MSSEEFVDKEAAQCVISFLKSTVSKSDVPNIEAELKKDFVLAKRKSKRLKRKVRKKKARTLTRKEKKSLGFYDLPRNSVKFEDVLPMHHMWSDYISQLLELDKPVPDYTSKGWESFTLSLYKADFHGSMLTVLRSKCPSYVSKTGICVMDTRNTFKIVSNNNVITTIPKRECVFEVTVKNKKIMLFGKHLCVRPAERSNKKLKSYIHPDLC